MKPTQFILHGEEIRHGEERRDEAIFDEGEIAAALWASQ